MPRGLLPASLPAASAPSPSKQLQVVSFSVRGHKCFKMAVLQLQLLTPPLAVPPPGLLPPSCPGNPLP